MDDLVVQSQRFRRRSPLAIVNRRGMSDGRFVSVAIALGGEGG